MADSVQIEVEELTHLGIYYIDIETLSAYDLIESLTLNNVSHEVKCGSFNALVKRAKTFASPGPDGKLGLPYYVYRFETNNSFERDFRISPTKTRYWGQDEIEMVYDKELFIDRIKDATWNQAVKTLDEDWDKMPINQQQSLYKIAKGNYTNYIEANVRKFNEKIHNTEDVAHTIGPNERSRAITAGRLPAKDEFEPYKIQLKQILKDFLNRTRGDVRKTDDGYTSSAYNVTTDDEADPENKDQQSEEYWEDPAEHIQTNQQHTQPSLDFDALMNRDFPVLNIPEDAVETTPFLQKVQGPSEGNVTQEIIEMGMSRHAATSTPFARADKLRGGSEVTSTSSVQDPIGTPRKPTRPPPPQLRPKSMTTEKNVTFPKNILEQGQNRENSQSRENSPIRGVLRKPAGTTQTVVPGATQGLHQPMQRRGRDQPADEHIRPIQIDHEKRKGSASPTRQYSSDEKPKWEFGAKQVNYTDFDHRDQDQAPNDFFNNLLMEINTNLKRGTVWEIPVLTLFQLVKATIKHKEKKKAFEREVSKRHPRNMNELRACFADSMTISNQLRKTRFNKITSKPPNETWVDFAQKFEKMFEVAYGMDSEGGSNQVLMERFQRCLNTAREAETLQQYLLMVDEKFQNIHSLAEKLEIVEYLTISKTEEKHPVYMLKAKSQVICNFCTKSGHSESECRKKKALQAQNPFPEPNIPNKSRSNQDRRGNNQRQATQQGCNRCGRNNHTTNDCFANINGQQRNHNNQHQNNYQNNKQQNNNWNQNRQVQYQDNRNQDQSRRQNDQNRQNGYRQHNEQRYQNNNNQSNNWNNNQSNNWNNNQSNNWNNNQRNRPHNNQHNNGSNFNNNYNSNNRNSGNGHHHNDVQNNQGNRNDDTNYKFNKFRRQ